MKSVFLYVDETTENKENFGLEESEDWGVETFEGVFLLGAT